MSSKFVCTLATPTDKGAVANPVNTTATLNGKPIALVGSVATHPNGPDTVLEGVNGILLNGVPLTFSGAKTAKGATLMPDTTARIISESYSGNPQAPAMEGPEEPSTTVKLESDYALQELFRFTKKDSKAMFAAWMMKIFGVDIPTGAYNKLYYAASNQSLQNPVIKVVKNRIHGRQAAYNNETHEIWVAEVFVRLAAKDNDMRLKLMWALMEEFGHHIDYLLRRVYSNTQKDDAPGDEGAKYVYQRYRVYRKYVIDPFKKDHLHFADAEVDGEKIPLKWTFEDIHQKLNDYVGRRKDKEDRVGKFEFFGAGKGHPEHGEFGHQSIEEAALENIFDEKARAQIYLGNWLRDFSQFVDPMVVRPMANVLFAMSEEGKPYITEIDKKNIWKKLGEIKNDNKVTHQSKVHLNLPAGIHTEVTYNGFPLPLPSLKLSIDYKRTEIAPVQLSREAITSFVALLAVDEFGEKKIKANEKEDYVKWLEEFKKLYYDITPEVLGVYRPEEHIDNPFALVREEDKAAISPGYKPDADKYGTPVNHNHNLLPDFVPDPVADQFKEGTYYGMKNFIRTRYGASKNGYPFPTAYECLLDFINKAFDAPSQAVAYREFGAAMHILEDYYAHSNFCEVAVAKVYEPRTFTWTSPLCNIYDKKTLQEMLPADRMVKPVHNKGKSYVRSGPALKIDTKTNPALHEQFFLDSNRNGKVDKGEKLSREQSNYYAHAECSPIVTGSFGLLDTVASILPKLNDKLFSITLGKTAEAKKEGVQSGERTRADALILELLRDLSHAQHLDASEASPVNRGTDDNVYVEFYKKYLDIRDAYLEDRGYLFGNSWSDVLGLFGIVDFVSEYINAALNLWKHSLVLLVANLIDDYQVLMMQQLEDIKNNTFKIPGNNPTHTQLAKDNPLNPYHLLAVTLAIKAVKTVGTTMADHLNGKIDKGTAKQSIIKDLDEFIRHPMHTSKMDEEVITWCKENRWRVAIGTMPSILYYSIYTAINEVWHGYEAIYAYLYGTEKEPLPASDRALEQDFFKLQQERRKLYEKLLQEWKKNDPEGYRIINPQPMRTQGHEEMVKDQQETH